MPVATRILDAEPVSSLAAYLQGGGGNGLAAARARIGEMQNRELFDAYVNTLKAKAKVEINQANLEKK